MLNDFNLTFLCKLKNQRLEDDKKELPEAESWVSRAVFKECL